MVQFFKGLNDYFRGHQLMISEGWLKWLLLPGLIAVVLITLLLLGFYQWVTPQSWLPAALHNYLGTSIRVMSSLFLSVLSYWILQPIIMMLLSPLFSHLAENIEYKQYGIQPNPFKVSRVIIDLFRSISMAVTVLAAMFSLIILFWLLSFIPVFGFLFASVLIPLVQMYFSGVGFADPPMERLQLNLRERWSFCWKHRFRVLGLGCGFLGLSMIPIIGWFLAPGYAIFASSVGITELFHQKK